ncbi:chemotaxis response regulator CheY [Desulfatiferula olefinivorans]
MRILVVDDDMVSRKKMEVILQEFGDCFLAESGRDAIRVFREASAKNIPFDLISLDISMPDINGIEVLKEIRQMETEGAVPPEGQARVMMVSSHADQDLVLGSVAAGCNNYIVKPFERAKVLEKLRALGFNV